MDCRESIKGSSGVSAMVTLISLLTNCLQHLHSSLSWRLR